VVDVEVEIGGAAGWWCVVMSMARVVAPVPSACK
jgi:hypothetical protein